MVTPELVVVPCGGRKLDRPAPAGELYVGSYHRACRAAADALQPRRVLILSALHGLLELHQVVEPYDLRMGQPGSVTPARIRDQAAALGLLDAAPVVALAGRSYALPLLAAWPALMWPLAGSTGMGDQLGRLARIRRAGAL